MDAGKLRTLVIFLVLLGDCTFQGPLPCRPFASNVHESLFPGRGRPPILSGYLAIALWKRRISVIDKVIDIYP